MTQDSTQEEIWAIVDSHQENIPEADDPIDNIDLITELFRPGDSIHALVEGLQNHDSEFAK